MEHQVHLEWSDFETNIRQSFRELREDQIHFDVTLATDDDFQIQAHKVIISSGSHFFNRILIKNKSPYTCIYLKGIKKALLKHVMDFLYNGETTIAQDELENFLEAAHELQVKGLEKYVENQDLSIEQKPKSETKDEMKEDSLSSSSVLDIQIEAELEILMEKKEGIWMCKNCGKTAKDKSLLKRHAETHIQGVQHTCHLCKKISSTRIQLKGHIANMHSGISFDCDMCSKTGMTKNGFYKHKKNTH